MMKPLLVETNSLGLKLQAILKGDKREFAISQTVTIGFFLAFAVLDIVFSLNVHLISDAIIMTGIFLLQAVAVLILRNKPRRYLDPQNIFLITISALFL